MSKGILKRLALFGVWILLFAVFSILLPENFPTARNLETLIRQTVIVGAAAIGMTFIIIASDIDLSVGSLVALVTVAIAWALKSGWDPFLAAAFGIAVGGLGGLINGVIITKFKVTSFIVTLATLLAFRGLAKGIADEKKIDAPLTMLSNLTAALRPEQKWMLLPVGGWIVVFCAILGTWLLNSTVFGRHTVAMGSNEATAKMCGVNTDRLRVCVFVLAGCLVGLAGLMQFSRLTVGDPTAAQGLELSIIAAVVIGGASLSGGEGSISGSLIGALIMTTISSGGSQLGWKNWVQEIVTGAIILGAVTFDRWRASKVAEQGG